MDRQINLLQVANLMCCKVRTSMMCSLCSSAPLNTTDHYQLVRKALLTLRPQWRNIGLELNIASFRLNEFCGSFENKMDKMLEVWLNHTFSTPTWAALVKALRDYTVEGGKPVAAEIEAKYIKPLDQGM